MDEKDLIMVTRRFAATTARFLGNLPVGSPASKAVTELARSSAATGCLCAEDMAFANSGGWDAQSLAEAEREVVRTRYWLDLASEIGVPDTSALDTLRREVQEVRDLIRAVRKRRGA